MSIDIAWHGLVLIWNVVVLRKTFSLNQYHVTKYFLAKGTCESESIIAEDQNLPAAAHVTLCQAFVTLPSAILPARRTSFRSTKAAAHRC